MITPERQLSALPDVCTPEEVAAFFRRSVATINEWGRKGYLRRMANTGGSGGYRYTKDAVIARMKQMEPITCY